MTYFPRAFPYAIAILAAIASRPAFADTIPEIFTFVDQSGAEPQALVESNVVTVSGIDAPANISVTGGDYRIGTGAYTTSPGSVANNQTVQVRATAGAFSATVDVALNIGGVSDTFSVTSRDANSDTVEDAEGGTVTVQTNAGTLLNLRQVAASVYASSLYEYPNGFFAFDVDVANPGDTAIVTMTLPAGSAPAYYVKCTSSTCAVFGGASINGSVVTLTLIDGGAGDTDNLANGTISDPGAPATNKTGYVGGGGGGGYGGGALGWLTIALGTGLALLRRL